MLAPSESAGIVVLVLVVVAGPIMGTMGIGYGGLWEKARQLAGGTGLAYPF